MKKVSTTITENGKTKTISVWLDERTVKVLEQVNDRDLTRRYIIDEYQASLVNRRETRRHQSLDLSMDNGWDISDDHCYENDVFVNMDKAKLHEALKTLTPEQQELIRRVYFDGESQKDIADELGLDKTSIRDRLKTIYKKIRNFFEN